MASSPAARGEANAAAPLATATTRGEAVRHVSPNSTRGGWDVTKPGAKRVSAHLATKDEAIARARQIVHNQGGGTVQITDGKGRFTRTVAIAVAPDGGQPGPRVAPRDPGASQTEGSDGRPARTVPRLPVLLAVLALVGLLAARRLNHD